MTLWYDVSDLASWPLGHLTGIQRTIVGALNGLVARGVKPRLVQYNAVRRCFEHIQPHALPAAIRRHLPWAEEPAPAALAPAAGESAPRPPQPVRRKRQILSRERVFGTSPAAAELRQSFREFKAATRQVRKKFTRWARVRFRETAPQVPLSAALLHQTTKPCELPEAVNVAGPFAPGDVLISLCAFWTIPGHTEAISALRSQGIVIVRMIYDLIPTIKPQWVDDTTCRVVTRCVRNLLTFSDTVLTISEFSRHEIVAYCEESRIQLPSLAVVRLGDDLNSSHDKHPPLPRFVPQRPFFVCVCTLDVRKNHRLLYDAWQVLASRDSDACPDLVCLGVPHLYVADLLREIRQDRRVNGRIHFLNGIADDELAWYYRHCAATIYPSRYEGWGLPVAESLGHGRLCLASNATSIPEISADLPAFFDPLDVYGLVSLVEKTLRDPAWVEEREAEIRRTFRPTPWSHTAGQIITAAEAASRARGQSREAA